ncbi:unnamed protein product [Linum tenue]|uniref:SAWADEE domain-containing protein n=1 Tax=Linum tenue TaxID=586396 RepID=A0AAV0LGE3_9ROSI|nr:unnamed protein product [Linum tenue]
MSATAAIPGGKSFSPPSGYNLEFRSLADDAWYAARAILSGKKLAVKYDDLDFVFEPHRFSDLDELRDYESRFRSVSRRLQDSECKKLCKKKAVCVSHSFHENDNRFYDATVDDVIEREHSFSSGKEVCKCVFAVVWQKGPWNGYVWHKSIEDIRIVESGSELDPDVTRFFNMARKEIAASGSASKVSFFFPRQKMELTIISPLMELGPWKKMIGKMLISDGAMIDMLFWLTIWKRTYLLLH